MRQRIIGNKITVAKLFTGVCKGLDASQISWIQPDRRLPRYCSDRGKKRLNPVGKTIRLLCYSLSGAVAGDAKDGLVNRSRKCVAVNSGQIGKAGGCCLKRLNYTLKLCRGFSPSSSSAFFHAFRLAFLKAHTAAFLKPFGPACLEINLR